MIKKSIICKGLAALVAGSLFAISCQKVEESIQDVPQEAPVYQVSISASFADDATKAVSFDNDATPKPTATGRFKTTENIYVYNETTGIMLDGALHPTDISADGKSCNLTGTLTGAVTAGNRLTLAYNMNEFYAKDLGYCYFNYYGQSGTEGVIDGGLATGLTAVSLDGEGVLTTEEKASFQMQQAIFRLKFTDGTNPITVKTLVIQSTSSPHMVTYFRPFATEYDRYNGNSIIVSPASPTSDYLYVAVCIKDTGSPTALQFTVTDNEGNQYKASKAAPTGGFKNGSYYYSTAPIALAKQTLVEPTVAWTSVSSGLAVRPDTYNKYSVNGPWNGSSYDPYEITISGTSLGYKFSMRPGGTIHLSGLTATYDGNNSEFIYSTGDLNLDISGANSIACKNYIVTIRAEGTLKLSGNGTLTVTASSTTRYGLYASNYYTASNNSDASVLAAPGYTVSRSAMTDNGDGTYTWTYTVAPQP